MNEQLLKYKDYLLAQNKSLVYYNFIKLYFDWLQEKSLTLEDGYKQETITNFFIDNNYSANSKDNYIKAGRNFYTQFFGVIKQDNKWYAIKLIPVERKQPDFLTEEDIKTCIKNIASFHTDLMDSTKATAFFYFLFYTGLRKGEILNLKRADINLNENYVLVRTPNKGKTERKVFFSSSVRLKEKLIKYFDTELEVTNAFNMTLGKIAYICKLLCGYLNRRIFLHIFRHSNGRELYRKNINIQFIANQLGHSSTKTTEIYVFPDEKLTQQVINDAYKHE